MKLIAKTAFAAAFTLAAGAGVAKEHHNMLRADLMPGLIEAKMDHCGFPSDEDFQNFLKKYRENTAKFYEENNRPVPPEELDPYAPRYQSLLIFSSESVADAWLKSVDADATYQARHDSYYTGRDFSQCQALSAAKYFGSPVLVFGSKDSGRMAILPPKPI
jgi:hypothetical protein